MVLVINKRDGKQADGPDGSPDGRRRRYVWQQCVPGHLGDRFNDLRIKNGEI